MGTFNSSFSVLAIRLTGPSSDVVFKSYSSGRPCPKCSRNMHYRATLQMAADDCYIGACAACGYRDPQKVQLMRSCEGPMVVRRN